jgi:kynureninase
MFMQPALSERLRPTYPGWIGHADLQSATMAFEPGVGARRFQQGTPAIEPIYTARAGLRFLLEVGVKAMRERSIVLTQRVLDAAREHGITAFTPAAADRRGGMVCLNVPRAEAIVDGLAKERIDVDMRSDAGVRVGPFPCLDEADCDLVVSRISALASG